FLTRLWRSEGINWLVDESQLLFAQVSDEIQPQKLRLIDDNSAFTALSRQNIRFHRSSATELLDSMTSLVAHRDLQSTAVHIQRWQADQLSQDDASGLNLSAHTHSEQQGNEELSLEQAWSISPAWINDLNGEDQSTASSASQIDKLNQQLSAYQELQAKYFKAQTTVRDAQVGYWFELTEHPEIDLHTGSDREFLIYSKQFYQQNNLPKDLQAQVDALFKQSHWSLQERQGNHLTLVRRQIRMLPDYDPLQYRPNAYPQHARVVGPSGETLHVDQWGRIKVRFLFTRSDDHSHDGGAGSNDNDTDSAWVDVLTPWAGEGYGARFLPRVGELVVIDFFDGNVDRPFVLGRIHEAERHPTRFDVKGQLPDTKKLSGIRSQEVDGSGFNQLRFDDTTGQISVQLQSSHGASQLNLGNLSHPKEQATSDGRGEGFELRTDQWGAMRAGKGLLISTYAQDQAVADHLAAAEAQSLLKQGHDSMQMLSQVAVKQQTDALNVLSRLPKFIESLEIKSTQQALTRTVDLFKNGLSNDPLSTLKNCGSFVQEMGAFGSSTQSIVEQFKSQFTDSKEAISNLKQTIENLEEQGTEVLKGKLVSLKAKVNDQPLQVLGDLGNIIEQVKIDPEKYMTCGSFEKLNEFTPNKALQQIQGFMEGYTQGLETSNSQAKQEQGKLFRQALMLLASPNGIALTTPEDILLQASQDIAQGSQANINLSAQKNIVVQAQSKISLFAAEQGFRAFAAKGKLELQAQDDAIEAIARKVIKLISTEDKIEMISPKEISLNAGGSQLKINADGVFVTTGGKFQSKAGQHVFTGGAKV
ncbi:type VI secretion system Vgr family protein, partial [Acinetobacter brisouii]|uniref:type VI secretion system Vgr family protein n=1 Tax=Acinetobacter brisouii TaxID=396323 RepID=UPI0005F8643A